MTVHGTISCSVELQLPFDPALPVLFVSVTQDDLDADGMPPSVSVTLPQSNSEISEVIQLPVTSSTTEIALDELELVYAFIYARVGNRADAEDLTQLVALKAIPRLRPGSPPSAVRGYLFATARSVLGGLHHEYSLEAA